MKKFVFTLSILVCMTASAVDGLASVNVKFVYQGTSPKQDVRVIGEFKTESFYSIEWDKNGIQMVPDANNVYHAEINVEPDARFEYLFVIDGNRVLDPSNSRKVFNGPANTEASELIMPGYKVLADKVSLEKGEVIEIKESWQVAPVFIYLPPHYSAAKKYPVVYTADGSAWKDFMSLPRSIDRLIGEKAIEPVIAVMINPPSDRRNWYLYNPSFLEYVEHVVAFVDSKYSTLAAPESRLHIGTSAGGRASLYVGFERPKLFQNIALLSPGLNGSLTYYASFLLGQRRPNKKLKVWISAGSLEGAVLEDAQTLESYFRKLKINVRSNYTHEGHSFRAWEYKVEPVLKYFFPFRGGN
jgi:enterochelin esterase-like enzyme